jgi:uncharacterized protein with FMN-binding domain
MTRQDVLHARRNATVLGGTAVALGLVMLYPTSLNRTAAHRRPGTALAPQGIVAAPSAAAGSTHTPTPTTVTVNGTSVDTRYGQVQVQLTIRGTRVLTARAIDYPQSNGRDREINAQAVPVLEQETLRAQSARIDAVSGATYTSDGYRTSLQAALDAAHLA